MKLRRLTATTALLLALAPGAALAAPTPEVEDNDTRTAADGHPALVAGSHVSGGLATLEDLDAWRLHVGPGRAQVVITTTNTSVKDVGGDVMSYLADADAETVPGGRAQTGPGDEQEIRATLEGPATYYFYTQFYEDMGYYLFAAPGKTSYEAEVEVLSGALLADPHVAPVASPVTPPVTTPQPVAEPTVKPAPVACASRRKAVTKAAARVSAARRAVKRRSTRSTRRALATARKAHTRAKTRLADCVLETPVAYASIAPAKGYRRATAAERKAMSKAKVELTRRNGFFIGKKDPSYGYVCGRANGGKWGEGVRKVRGRWTTRGNDISSGELQSYALYCGAYDG